MSDTYGLWNLKTILTFCLFSLLEHLLIIVIIAIEIEITFLNLCRILILNHFCIYDITEYHVIKQVKYFLPPEEATRTSRLPIRAVMLILFSCLSTEGH